MMFCRTVGIAAVGLAVASAQMSSVGIKHVLDLEKYPQARCLDGTPGGFYVYGNGSTNSKWYIHHTGGGWCSTRVGWQQGSTADNCHRRKLGVMGSSSDKFYGPTIEDWGGDYGSGDPAKNPMMHDWNKVKLIYCDGGSFSGRNHSVANGLHFKGSFILEAIIDTLKVAYGLGHATDVVVSGGSAGGLATYLHVDKWRDSLPSSTFVVAMPDGGFFLDWASSKPWTSVHSYAYELRADFQDFNASVNKDCTAAAKSSGIDESVCMFAEHTVAFIKTPLFALQSVVDSWQLGNELGVQDAVHTNEYRVAATSRILTAFGDRTDRGGFIDSCVHHCGMWDELVIDGVRMADAFTIWYTSQRTAWTQKSIPTGKRFWWQAKAFPCKDCCGKGRLYVESPFVNETLKPLHTSPLREVDLLV